MFGFGNGTTVTVRRTTEPGEDQYGDPIPPTTTDRDIEDVAVAPRTSVTRESTDRPTQDGTVIGYTLYITDPQVDIVSTDLVKVKGRWCEVDGDAAQYENPFVVGFGGAVVQLKFAQGV